MDRGGTIFDTDDRYLFDDTSFPWRTTGKVRTEASGAQERPSVLGWC